MGQLSLGIQGISFFFLCVTFFLPASSSEIPPKPLRFPFLYWHNLVSSQFQLLPASSARRGERKYLIYLANFHILSSGWRWDWPLWYASIRDSDRWGRLGFGLGHGKLSQRTTEILEVHRGASKDEIRKAYRKVNISEKVALVFHFNHIVGMQDADAVSIYDNRPPSPVIPIRSQKANERKQRSDSNLSNRPTIFSTMMRSDISTIPMAWARSTVQASPACLAARTWMIS